MSTPTNPPVLCYVDDHWAYFTTQELSKQWGDDWNDAPYEHNAGEPYNDTFPKMEGHETWTITKVAFDGPFAQPKDDHTNSPWSVDQINAGAIAWLRTHSYMNGEHVIIPAGVTLDEFCVLIRKGCGNVYLPMP